MEGEPSFHVEYTVSEDGSETENLTHAEIIDHEIIGERGDVPCAWIAQLDDESIELMITDEPEMGWLLHHKITARTAEQLSDMFARIAAAVRLRIVANGLIRQAEEERIADLDARQGNLPLDDLG